MTTERRRLAVITTVTVAVAAAVAAVAVMAPWRSALDAERRTLTGIVANRLALIEAIQAKTDDPEATLRMLRDAHHDVAGIGSTGELVIARREGDQIVFLVQPRHAPQRTLRLPVGDGRALPMQRALAGETGTTTGTDYRGVTVVAAFAPVTGLGWGLVAKMDLAELRRPYVRTGAIAAAVIGAATLLGLALVRRELGRGITLLEASERRFRGTFETVPVSIWDEDWSEVLALVDRLRGDGVRDFDAFLAVHPKVVEEALQGVRIRDVNPATLQMFEAADKADLIRSLETVFSTPDTLPGFVGELVALASGQRYYRTEMALRTAAGRLIHTLLTMRFPGPDDGAGTVLVSLMDVSAEHALRQELQRLNTELENRVVERTRELAERQSTVVAVNRELRDAVARLEATNRELEAFTYTVSHDLRAPLRAIDGFSRILMTEHYESLEPEARRFLGLVRDNAQTMGRLIDDLLAFSRLSRHQLRTLPTPLADLVDEAWAALAPEREGRAVELEVDELPTVEVDPGLMKLVLVNLLGNALKFTRPRNPARIEVGCTGDGNGRACYVRDNGVGFDMRYASKLFGVFQRLHRAADFEGTGVGLATVQRILHRHGGRVWAESEPDRGATLFFSLHGGDHGDHEPG